jgi:hypothetical protein
VNVYDAIGGIASEQFNECQRSNDKRSRGCEQSEPVSPRVRTFAGEQQKGCAGKRDGD